MGACSVNQAERLGPLQRGAIEMGKSLKLHTGIVLAAITALAGCGPEPRRTDQDFVPDAALTQPHADDPIVARVNNTSILLSDVQREARAQSGDATPLEIGSEDYERILQELIDQRLLAVEARRLGLRQSEDVRRELARAEERILSEALVQQHMEAVTSEEVIRRIYDEQVQLMALGDEVRARHILVETEEEASAAKDLLDQGVDFATLAVRISQDHATRLDGGDLGYFTRQGILPTFGAVAFATAEGTISEPFQSEFGWHILMVVDRRRQPPPPYEVQRPRIQEFHRFSELETLVEDLRGRGRISRPTIPDEFLPQADDTGETAENPADTPDDQG